MKKGDEKNPYSSCIKINGVPILPPLLTKDKSKEIKKYRRQAIKIEKRLLREKFRKANKGALSDGEDKLDQVQSNISISSGVDLHEKDERENASGDAEAEFSKNQLNETYSQKLTCDIQSSQYIDNKFIIFNEHETVNSPLQVNDRQDFSTPILPQHKLVRSNSYVLESPSPVLLEFLKKNKTTPHLIKQCWCSTENLSSTSLLDDIKVITPNSYSDFFQDDKSLLEASFHNSSTEPELKFGSDNESHISENEFKLKQFIDNNVPNSRADYDIDEHVLQNLSAKVSTPTSDTVNSKKSEITELQEKPEISTTLGILKQILDDIPDRYSKHILELIEKQQLEISQRCDESKIELNTDNNQSIQSKQSFGNEFENYETIPTLLVNSKPIIHDVSINSKDKLQELYNTQEANINVSCQTPSPDMSNSRSLQKLKQEKAATIIGAAAKGFLVRRLLRTEKVQNLIQIIKDALMCAMQLHTETWDDIKASDVELHRRLIQQVSAACYAFNDVFFNTSVEEQMSFISVDRQKKKEKLKRPLSGSLTAKSTPRSSRSVNTIRSSHI